MSAEFMICIEFNWGLLERVFILSSYFTTYRERNVKGDKSVERRENWSHCAPQSRAPFAFIKIYLTEIKGGRDDECVRTRRKFLLNNIAHTNDIILHRLA